MRRCKPRARFWNVRIGRRAIVHHVQPAAPTKIAGSNRLPLALVIAAILLVVCVALRIADPQSVEGCA